MLKRLMLALYCLQLMACLGASQTSIAACDAGRTDRINIPAGRLKLRVYQSQQVSRHGVDVELNIEPGLEHNILLAPAVLKELERLIGALQTF